MASYAKLHAIAIRNVVLCKGRPPVAHINCSALCDVCSTEQTVSVMSMGLSWRSGWVLACDGCMANFPNYAMPAALHPSFMILNLQNVSLEKEASEPWCLS